MKRDSSFERTGWSHATNKMSKEGESKLHNTWERGCPSGELFPQSGRCVITVSIEASGGTDTGKARFGGELMSFRGGAS